LVLVNLSHKCKHEAACCVPCLTQAISNNINGKGLHTFQCPMPTCSVEFDPTEYQHLLDVRSKNFVGVNPKQVVVPDKWFRIIKICLGKLNFNDFSRCCLLYFRFRYYACYACQQFLCFRHSIEWHKGYTCDEFDAERAANPDLASDVTVLEFTKQCPNQSCRTPIMKLEGCDVMTCCRYGTHACAEAKGRCSHGGKNYCGQRFCWKCLGIIDINAKTGAYTRHCKPACEYASLNN